MVKLRCKVKGCNMFRMPFSNHCAIHSIDHGLTGDD
jgi:hypothetical protein